MTIKINGRDLTLEQVIKVSRYGEKVELTDEAKVNVKKARKYIEDKLESEEVIYGLTTGFGKFSTVFISKEETAD